MTTTLATRLLTADEARRAIYIDFEGRKDKPKVLLGALYPSGKSPHLIFRHYLLTREYSGLCDALRWTWPGQFRNYFASAVPLARAMSDLTLIAEKHDRLFVSWSQHELEVLEDADLPDRVLDVFRSRFRDGKATATAWRKRLHPDVPMPRVQFKGAHPQHRYMDLVGFQVPDVYGPGLTGTNLGKLDKALAPGTSFGALTETKQAAWRTVLGHNLYDCVGLRTVVMRAAGPSGTLSLFRSDMPDHSRVAQERESSGPSKKAQWPVYRSNGGGGSG